MYRYHGRANAIRPYNNPQNPVNPVSKLIFTGKIPLKYPSSPKPKTTFPIFVGNYARSSHWFESGFTGFIGLTITSLARVGRLSLKGFSYRRFSPMRYASAKRRVKSNPQQIILKPKTKTSSVILKIL
jgi:hypothetical protein